MRVSETLCWDCAKACGRCSWSSNFVPVDGWEAIPCGKSYEVVRCPEFEGDCRNMRVMSDQLARLLDVSVKTISRLSNCELIEKARGVGYRLTIDGTTKRLYYVEVM